jgi:hypothetical protein
MKYLILLLNLWLFSCNSVSLDETSGEIIAAANHNTPTVTETKQISENVVSDIPKNFWEKLFFEEIDERSKEAKIKSLRKTKVNSEDIEVRIWMGFGLSRLEGFILKRTENNWSAMHIATDYVSNKFINRNKELSEPQIGWNPAWEKLLSAQILTLPDAQSINCMAGATDGFSFVVEAKKGDNYRTYMYENPDVIKKDCKEAAQMIEIYKILETDYGLK